MILLHILGVKLAHHVVHTFLLPCRIIGINILMYCLLCAFSAINDWLSQIQADPGNQDRKTCDASKIISSKVDIERAWVHRGMKRKRDSSDEENSESEVDPASPVKTVNSRYKRIHCNVTEETPAALPVKSFYGANKKRNVSAPLGSPLIDVHNLHMTVSMQKPPTVISTKRVPSNKLKSQSTRRKAKPQHRVKAKACIQKPVLPKSLKSPEASYAKSASPLKPDCTKKFFRYRSSQHSASMTVMQKGFQLKFVPGRRSTDSGKSVSKQNSTKQDNHASKNSSPKPLVSHKRTTVNQDIKEVTNGSEPISPDLFSESSQIDICPGSNTNCLEDSRHDSGMSFGSSHTAGDTLDTCTNRSPCSDASVADSVLLLPTNLSPQQPSPNGKHTVA